MSEKIYVWLLRLYPSHFRTTYGEEALQLFRDRSRDERGPAARLRLWLDLLVDLAVSLPRQQRSVQSPLAVASSPDLGGTPSFHVLGREPLRMFALLFGGVVSLAGFGGCSFLVNHDAASRSSSRSAAQSQRPGDSPASKHTAQRAAKSRERQTAGIAPNDTRSHPTAAAGLQLDAAERHRVIDAAIANLNRYYIDPIVAHKMADALLAHEKRGDYDAITDGAAFAALLTRQLRDVSQDMHLDVAYSQRPLPHSPPAPTPEGRALYREMMEQQKCTFEKVEILANNIGYLKLNSFPDPSVCQPTATSVMAWLNQTDAIIFDLRENGGGSPDMVMLIASYLFDHPEYMYNPKENTTERSWTHSPVPGSRLADKPVFVLTSAKTFSGAEHFSYDLKMLKRATLVGETTGGAAHSGVFHRIEDHFGIGIPEARPINPFSKTDWAVTGVEPDVKVKAADALVTAEKLAESKRRKKQAIWTFWK